MRYQIILASLIAVVAAIPTPQLDVNGEAPDDILTPPDSPDASDLTDECGYKGRNRGRESGFACDIGFEEVAALGSDAEEMIDDVVAIVEDVTDEFVDDDAEEFVDDDTEDFDSNELSAK